MLHDLRLIPHGSGLYLLGLFAVLELLLAHKPEDRENADSLSHQLSTKIPLIDRRLSSRIDYSSIREITSPERLWKILYAYRSAIAHGEQLDFSTKFRVLVSHDTTRLLVQQACRKLLRHALKEPILFRDLKAVYDKSAAHFKKRTRPYFYDRGINFDEGVQLVKTYSAG
jgi:hypothetical protein